MNTPRSAINSSSPVPIIYTLKQLQDLNDAVANEMNAKIPKVSYPHTHTIHLVPKYLFNITTLLLQLNWTRYIEEIFTGLNNVTLDLSDPNKVQISIEELDFVKDMLKLIYSKQDVKDIGKRW